MKTVVTDSFHCQRCNAFIGSVERDTMPAAPTAADERAAAPGEAPPVATEEAVEAAATAEKG